MSSVAGARSLLGASDELYDYICDPCNFRGIQKQGISYCKNCEEKLCQTCTDVHKGQKMSRNHTLIPVSQLSETSSFSSTCHVLCDCSQNSVVRYCKDHDDVICQSCCVIKHRACKTMPIAEKCASYQKEKFIAVTLKANKLKDEADEILNKRKFDIDSYTTMATEAEDDMRSYRQEINKRFDTMEQCLLTDIDNRKSRNRREVDGHISSCETTMQLLQTDLKTLDDAKKTTDKVDMFAAEVKVSKRLAEYERLLRDINQEAKSTRITFRKNDTILDMLANINNIGTLEEQTTDSSPLERNVFTRLQVKSVTKTNIKTSIDRHTPAITGCVCMPHGNIILCDWVNLNLKLLDKSFTPQDSLRLQHYPWNISMINDTTIITTLPDQPGQKLQFVELTPRLTLGQALQLDKQCYGAWVHGRDIYVTCHRGGHGCEGEMRILDENGKLRKRLGVNQDCTFMFARPYYITVSAKSKNIFVSDANQNTLTCLKTDGTIIFQYKDPELQGPMGVAVDEQDNVIVCGADSNNIHVVTNDGKKHSVFLTSKDGISNPHSVAYRQTDQTLIIGCYNSNNLHVVQCVTK